MKAVVITGASTGIGKACVKTLIENGFIVFAAVRKEDDAAKIAAQHGDAAFPLRFDVTDRDAIAAAAAAVSEKLAGATLAGLVNNAGVAITGPLLHLPIDDMRRQFEVNLFGQMQVIQAFAPLLGAGAQRQGAPGRLINMSSVAGRFASPFMGPYCGSKFALEGMSDSLRRELMIYGVDVVVIEPGAIATPIWEKSADAPDHWEHTIYAPAARRMRDWALKQGMSGPGPEIVAKAVLRALTAKNPPVRIPVVKERFTGYTLPGLLPTRLVDWLVARALGLSRHDHNHG